MYNNTHFFHSYDGIKLMTSSQPVSIIYNKQSDRYIMVTWLKAANLRVFKGKVILRLKYSHWIMSLLKQCILTNVAHLRVSHFPFFRVGIYDGILWAAENLPPNFVNEWIVEGDENDFAAIWWDPDRVVALQNVLWNENGDCELLQKILYRSSLASWFLAVLSSWCLYYRLFSVYNW